jgi:hypothetical protein
VPLADGTLIATPDIPSADLLPSLVAASDVLGTGWFGAVAAADVPAGARGVDGLVHRLLSADGVEVGLDAALQVIEVTREDPADE